MRPPRGRRRARPPGRASSRPRSTPSRAAASRHGPALRSSVGFSRVGCGAADCVRPPGPASENGARAMSAVHRRGLGKELASVRPKRRLAGRRLREDHRGAPRGSFSRHEEFSLATPTMHDDDGGMTTLRPMLQQRRSEARRRRHAPPSVTARQPRRATGLAFRECGPSAARDAQHQARPLRRLVATIRLWRRRAQERRELLGMPDIELRDIGISRSEAWQAARKPVWRA